MVLMTKNEKRLLFYCAILIFVIGSYIAILYAQGYKYDFSKSKFLKTGTFYLKVNTESDVYVNGQYAGNTSFLGTSFSEDRLLPGIFDVVVKKDGYSEWHKKITVEEGLVSDFANIMLFPLQGEDNAKLLTELETLFKAKELASSSLPIVFNKKDKTLSHIFKKDDQVMVKNIGKNVVTYKISKDENKIAWTDTSNELWIFWLKDSNYQPFHEYGDTVLIYKSAEPLSKISWFRNSEYIALDLINGYKIIEIDERGGTNIANIR